MSARLRSSGTTHGGGPLGGWGPSDSLHVDARGGIAATLSATVSGGPVRFHLYLEDIEHGWKIRSMKPKEAIFDPGTGTASSSFTFVACVRPGSYTVNIDWGSPTGAQVTLHAMTPVVQYAQAR